MRCLIFLLAYTFLSAVSFAQNDTVVAVALPLQVVALETKTVNNNVQLTWKVNSNEDAKSFEVERSTDGSNFQKIGGKLSNARVGTEAYEFVDAFLKKSTGFSYRIKIIAKDGDTKYSSVQTIADDVLGAVLKQNPVRNNIELQLVMNEAALLQADIYSSYGQKMKTGTEKLSIGTNNVSIDAQNLATGLYRLVLDCGGKRQVISFVKE